MLGEFHICHSSILGYDVCTEHVHLRRNRSVEQHQTNTTSTLRHTPDCCSGIFAVARRPGASNASYGLHPRVCLPVYTTCHVYDRLVARYLKMKMEVTHRGRPDWCDKMSRIVAFDVAQSSINFHSSGRMSTTFVYQSKRVTPAGRGVLFLPWAKSSMSIPTELDRNAFEHDARSNKVCAA